MNAFTILKSFSINYKEIAELCFWRIKQRGESVLSNLHYKEFYSSHFGLEETYYNDKIVLDIGCGPRGSLEWANKTKCRIGLDPLSTKYRKLGTKQHKMNYLTSYSENIPLKAGKCNVVCSFNSLDHVEDVMQTIREIKRITCSGGLFLLIVEVNHKPKICEPHQLSPGELIEMLKPEFTCDSLRLYKPVSRGIYKSIRIDDQFENPESVKEKGYMSACFKRNDAG